MGRFLGWLAIIGVGAVLYHKFKETEKNKTK